MTDNRTRIPMLEPYTVKMTVSTLSETEDYNHKLLNVPEMWKKSRGSGVRVVVLDTGCPQHIDIDVKGFKDFSGSSDAYDHNGHATHVCGIIAAKVNGIGVRGIAPDCELYCGKVLGDDGDGAIMDIAAGIRWAVDEVHADVVNLSLGCSPSFFSYPLKRACQYARNKGVVLCCAAGNDAGAVNAPASYDTTIAVAAVDRDREAAYFTCHGSEVDFAAGGVDVFSTWLDGQYAKLSGTSMATPAISGAVALIIGAARADQKKMAPGDVYKHLLSIAIDVEQPGKDDYTGNGIPVFTSRRAPSSGPHSAGAGMEPLHDPCAEYAEGTEEHCTCQGNYWCSSKNTCVPDPADCCILEGGYWCGQKGCVADEPACCTAEGGYWCEPRNWCVQDQNECAAAECEAGGRYWCEAITDCVDGKPECCIAAGRYWCDLFEDCVDDESECDPCFKLDRGTPEHCELCEGGYWCEGTGCVPSEADCAAGSSKDPCGEFTEGTSEHCECTGRYWCELTAGSGTVGQCVDSGYLCDPCHVFTEGTQDHCEQCAGGYWCVATNRCVADATECDECAPHAPGTPAHCHCTGGYWCDATSSCLGSETECPPAEGDDPCTIYGEDSQECCEHNGGTWDWDSDKCIPAGPSSGKDSEAECNPSEGDEPCSEFAPDTLDYCECIGGTWDGCDCTPPGESADTPPPSPPEPERPKKSGLLCRLIRWLIGLFADAS